MAVVITFKPTGGVAAYTAALAELEDQGKLVQLHRLAHYASGTDENFQVVDIWSSEEAFNDFAADLLPILAKTGLEPGEPEIRRLLNTTAPGVELLDDIGLHAWNAHDAVAWVGLFANEFTLSDPNLAATITSTRDALEYIQNWYTAFPDMQVRRLDRVCSTTRVAGLVEFTGRHDGPLVGALGTIEPTGRHVTGGATYTVTANEDGKVTAFTVIPDVLGMMVQLGVDPTSLD